MSPATGRFTVIRSIAGDSIRIQAMLWSLGRSGMELPSPWLNRSLEFVPKDVSVTEAHGMILLRFFVKTGKPTDHLAGSSTE
jgi:hypothetical protein